MVTQLGECKTEDLEVAGSSPAHGTMILNLSLSYVEKGGLCTQKYTISISIDWNIESLRYLCIAIIATIVPRMCFIR